jgi:RecA-family ATPase
VSVARLSLGPLIVWTREYEPEQAVGLAISVASGWGGRENEITRPQGVLYVALEDSDAAVRARISAIADRLGIDPDGAALDRLFIVGAGSSFDLADTATVGALREEAERIGAALVVVDSWRWSP